MLNAVESEAVILAWCMLDSVLCRETKDSVEPDFFWADAHKRVFEAIASLMETGTPVDSVTVSQVMRDRDTLGQLEDGLVGIERQAIVREHFSHHLAAVRSAYFGRRIIQESHRLIANPEDLDILAGIQRLALARETVEGESIFNLAKDLPGYLDYIDEAKNHQQTFNTGFSHLDKILNVARVGDLTTVAGRPGGGKSALMVELAFNLAKSGSRVLMFSSEMSRYQVVDRIMPIRSSVFAYKFRKRNFDEPDYARIKEVCADLHGKISIFVDDNPRPGMLEFYRDTARIKPNVVIVDYLQRCKRPRAENMTRSTDEFMTALKTFSLESKVWTILGCQMNRTVDRLGEPTLSDLRDSGAIESESDQVILLHTEGKRSIEEDMKIKAIIGKNRHGACGFSKLAIDKNFANIKEIEENDNARTDGAGSESAVPGDTQGAKVKQSKANRKRLDID